MSDCFKSKGIGMPAGGAPVPRMMAGPANPSGMYDSKNKLAKFDDIKMKTCVANIIGATFKLKQQCGTLIASSRRLMQFGIRQAWRNTIGRELEPPWNVYIDFNDNDKSSVETRFKEVADKFSCILRREWYPRGTFPTMRRPRWLPSEEEAVQLEVALEWWSKHVLAAGLSGADYKINHSDATLLEADSEGGSDNAGPSGLCGRGVVRPRSNQGGRGGSGGRSSRNKANKRPKVAADICGN